jgi:PAS domain S-box-containing protein
MKRNPDNLPRYIDCDRWVMVLDQLNIGAFTIDSHRRITGFNSSAKSVLGQRSMDVIGKDCRDVFHGVPCYSNCPFHVADTGKGTPELEIVDDRNVRHFITRYSTPLYGPDREVAGCLTMLQDHSPIAELISKVSYEERSMKIILDNLNIGIMTVNRGQHVTFFNTAAEKTTGFSRRDILGKPCATLFGGDENIQLALLRDSIASGRHRGSLEGEVKTSAGSTVPVRANYLPLQNEQGEIIGGLVTLQDLTLIRQLDQVIRNQYTFHQVVGKDPAMQKIFEIIKVVAPSEATVLIEGATGTGKDLLAKVIHSTSRRSRKSLIKVNCAALPENLLESELFGYVRGAFTGADRDKPGRFQEADQGTIFLDEIGDLPLNLQAKLLRVLEEKKFYPLGSRRVVRVNVRIIAASNRGLVSLVEKGLFRDDLFYRLNVVQIEVPSLKNRQSDIPLLINDILRRLCVDKEYRSPEISEEAKEVLLNYHYPGNVRELENILEHALIINPDGMIRREHLPAYVRKWMSRRFAGDMSRPSNRHPAVDKEREALLQALEQNRWQRTQTARALNINRTTLWRRMRRYGLFS